MKLIIPEYFASVEFGNLSLKYNSMNILRMEQYKRTLEQARKTYAVIMDEIKE